MNKAKSVSKVALFNLGFRPFYLGAGIFSIIVMLVWMAIFSFGFSLPMTNLSISQWHAHEMIYGYSLAVIAGFLLTAVKNWTGIQTLHSTGLAILFCLWFTARILFLFGTRFINLAGIFDILFIIFLIAAILYPVIKSKQWSQIGISSKLILLAIFNITFYCGASGITESGVYLGIYGGFYLIIGLILTLGGRVIPFFIRSGVEGVEVYNPKWITLVGLAIFLIFFISELFLQNTNLTGITSAILFIIYSFRLGCWYTPGIWKKPLLWSLYLSMMFINIGFLLFVIHVFFDLPKSLAIHAFSYAGIGLITVAMMARVTLGHTGRDINQPPALVKYIFFLLITGAIVRVFLPMVLPAQYGVWIFTSQLLWIIAFSLYVAAFMRILTTPRVDGKFG